MLVSQTNWAYWIAGQVQVVPIAYGSPGTAKTAFCRSLANHTGRQFLQLILRQIMPEDVKGIPVPGKIEIGGVEHDGVRFLLNEDLLRARHEPTVLLLDEMNHAGHDVLGAVQEMINDPPPKCWMFAAANPVEQSTSGVELAPPVINRMCKLEWETPVNSIVAGWQSGFFSHPEPNIPIVPENYLDDSGEFWGKTLAEFHVRFRDLFDNSFPKDANLASEPWLSYRSFTNVGLLMCACDAVGANKSVRSKLVRGCIGDGAANQFLQYVAELDLPDPEDLLTRPDSLKLPVRFDITRTIIASVIGAVQSNSTPARWEQARDVLEVAFDQRPEAAMAAEGKLFKIKPQGHLPLERNGAAAKMRDLRLATTS